MKLGQKQVATVSQTKDGLVKLTLMNGHDFTEVAMTPDQASEFLAELAQAIPRSGAVDTGVITIQTEWPEDA